MTIRLHLTNLKELRHHPNLIKKITSAAEQSAKELSIDLGDFIHDEPFAFVEFVLLARSLGVRLVLEPEMTEP
jgi:hypothetical protein